MAATAALAPIPETLRFVCLSPGVYDSADGRVTLYRLLCSGPPGWNVEWTIDYQNRLVDLACSSTASMGACSNVFALALTLIVDGAASFRDAKALAADAWPALRERLAALEEAS